MDEFEHPNPLIRSIHMVQAHVDGFQRDIRSFYFDVILSTVKCPQCEGRMKMTGQSQCRCQCGRVLDPTIAFQVSHCCGVRLLRKTFHYVCSLCGQIVPSRFIFNERIFDKVYFKEMMRSYRERKNRKREEMRQLLAASRSNHLDLMVNPDLDEVPGLLTDLDEFVGSQVETDNTMEINLFDSFNMEDYRIHILSGLNWNPVGFSKIAPLTDNRRKDRARRFITLIFMQNEKEIKIEQLENDLLIQKVYNEAHG